jgi:hypothetical protein
MPYLNANADHGKQEGGHPFLSTLVLFEVEAGRAISNSGLTKFEYKPNIIFATSGRHSRHLPAVDALL